MFGFFKKGLRKTAEAMKSVAPEKRTKIPKDELEDILLEADVEYDLIEVILRELYDENVTRKQLESKLLAALGWAAYEPPEFEKPFVDLVIGVNGAGKTTTIAKLAKHYLDWGERVLLGASDTFRAAGIEQLTRWADRLGVPIVSSRQGHDPSAVAYDAIESAKARGFEHVVIDTAGRLHTQTNLAEELKKIVRICNKAHEGAPHRKILIIDGTQGNSAIAQAKAFDDIVDVDGIIVTKLDGTAKGGAIFSIAYALRLPIFYIGVGEKPEDLVVFDKYAFVDDFLDAVFEPAEATDRGVDFTRLTDDQRKVLAEALRADGYEMLSKHFVRNMGSWEEYRLQPNESASAMEVVDKSGNIVAMYTADIFKP
jgi:fused signal recognition particle receptor